MSCVHLSDVAFHENITARIESESWEKLDFRAISVFSELLNCALLTAATASIANSMHRSATANLKQIASHLPPEPVLFPQMYPRLVESATTSRIAVAIADYYSRLQPLRSLIRSCVRSSEAGGVSVDIEASTIALAWQHLADQALGVIEHLEDFKPDLSDLLRQKCHTVSNLLSQAHAGGTPCLNAVGSVELPNWAERRIQKRTVHNIQAVFIIGDRFQRAAVLDASDHGLGVLGLRDISVGERVGLVTKPGLQISGVIIWVNGPRAGIELDTPLPAGCQILASLH